MEPPSDTSKFYLSELALATREQEFGLESVGPIEEIRLNGSAGAQVSITVLEGTTILVHLSLSGYKIVAKDGKLGPSYDTFDNLLAAVSPMWEEKRIEKLMEKLSQVERQQEVEDEEDQIDLTQNSDAKI